MSNAPIYSLVHIVTGGEYKTPLVASQVFDRAQVQATLPGEDKPQSVSVWIIVPMREVYDEDCKKIVTSLQQRCPDIKINMVGGISRLGNWPMLPTMKKLRRKMKGKVVYHCRGESSYEWGDKARQLFKGDAVVIDIRGYWPLERLINSNVTQEADMTTEQKAVYDSDVTRLKRVLAGSEWMCTVSEPLRRYMITHCGAREDSVLIPCCVNSTVNDTDRERIREEMQLTGKTAILYLGGTQKYQSLGELVMPFMRAALSLSEKNVAVFITQDKEKMSALMAQYGIDHSRTRMISVPQNKVAAYLTAMDLGLLLRASSPLNNFSQPVKFGEYLSAGIPVVLEAGTGDIAGLLNEHKTGCVISLEQQTTEQGYLREVAKALDWYNQNKNEVRESTRRYVAGHYTWAANAPRERGLYVAALQVAGSTK